ncbi:MAG: exonuclease domain-containing protein [Gemmatimonadota bacterium]|nr:exonuclease domain-containing protein [Gemmatimonadota bacterium]
MIWGSLRRWWRGLRSVSPYELPELVSLDLETSNLDPRTAEILSIAAVPIRGRRVMLSERFERVVRATAAVDPEAVKYHRLRPVDVEHGVPPEEAVAALLEWLDDRPLLGYCIGFDCAMIERVLARSAGGRLEGPRLDLRELYRRRVLRRNPEDSPSQALDDILVALEIPAVGRHSALGDATAVAMAFLELKLGAPRKASPAARRAARTTAG